MCHEFSPVAPRMLSNSIRGWNRQFQISFSFHSADRTANGLSAEMVDEVHIATLALNIQELCWRARPKGAYLERKEEWPMPDEASRVFEEAVLTVTAR